MRVAGYSLHFGPIEVALEPRARVTRPRRASVVRIRELASEVCSRAGDGELDRAVEVLLALADEAPLGPDKRAATQVADELATLREDAVSGLLTQSQIAEERTRLLQATISAADWYAGLLLPPSPSTPEAPASGDDSIEPPEEASWPPSEALAECHGLTWSVPERTIVRNASLAIHVGEIVGLVGPNGAGKTSFLRLLAGVNAATSGHVSFPLLEGHAESVPANDDVFLVGQSATPYAGTLDRSLRLFAALHGIPSSEIDGEVAHAIQRFGLHEYRETKWRRLAAGYQTRFELAKATLASPHLLLLDEPLGPLDPVARRDYLRWLRYLVKSRRAMAIVLSSHDTLALQQVADRVLVIRDGRLTTGLRGPASTSRFELQTSADVAAVERALAPIGDLRMLGDDMLVELEFIGSVESQQVIRALAQADLPVRYFRDLSQDPR